MKSNDLRQYIRTNILTSTETCELLQISRQRLSTIVKSGTLDPIKNVAQTSIFLRADVEDYIGRARPKLFLGNSPPLYDYSSYTNRSLKFFEDNIHSLSKVSSIFIYFDQMDALLNNFFQPAEDYKGVLLRGLHIPHLIIRDINGQELWLGGCRCGYGGVGPSGSVEILRYLNANFNLKFPQNYEDIVYSNRVVNFFVNDDDTVDVISRDSFLDSSDDNGYVSAYYHTNRLVLLQDPIRSVKGDAEKKLITKYHAFIPNPVEVFFFPNANIAKEAGYTDLSQNAYNVIIIDSSGRELWLSSLNISINNSRKQDTVQEILELCGFAFEEDDRFIQKVSEWLSSALRLVRPISAPSRYVKKTSKNEHDF